MQSINEDLNDILQAAKQIEVTVHSRRGSWMEKRMRRRQIQRTKMTKMTKMAKRGNRKSEYLT